MNGYHFCGLAESLNTHELRRDPVARWFLDGQLSRINREQLRPAVASAFAAWTGVCNCEGVEATSPEHADLIIQVVRTIDGRGGVLADCQLPGPRVQLMRLDDAELWTLELGPNVAANLIDAARVLTHELGHFWGLGHGGAHLMAPSYSRSIWLPGDWETAEMRKLYGLPKPRKSDPPAGGADTPAEMWIKGETGRWLVGYKLAGRIA